MVVEAKLLVSFFFFFGSSSKLALVLSLSLISVSSPTIQMVTLCTPLANVLFPCACVCSTTVLAVFAPMHPLEMTMHLISLSERSCNTTIVLFDEVKRKESQITVLWVKSMLG